MKVLLVEDDAMITSGLTYALEQEGFAVISAATVSEALSALRQEDISLVLLDVGLPDGEGYTVCRSAKQGRDVPVIFLTAVEDEGNVVKGLDMGADDYITKPFRIRELLSRIRSVLRRYDGRTGRNGSEGEIRLGRILISVREARVQKNGQDVPLTGMEYRLLLRLAQNPGQVFSRNQLLEGIWDVSGDFVNDNTLTVYIKRLREKLEDDPAHPELIRTVRGLGYSLEWKGGGGPC